MSGNSCTAPDMDCHNLVTRNGLRDVHKGGLCNTCWTRIRNQHTVECSASTCSGRILKDQSKATEYKGRTKPQPWCRRHEQLALAAETIGLAARERILAGYAKNITPDWDSEFGCWNWKGKKLKPKSEGMPYGHFWRKVIGSWAAHRLGFHLFYSSTGYSSVIDHRCCNRLCVNPLHLQSIPKRINDQLQGKRNDRDGIIENWAHDQEAQFATEELKEFARSNELPLRTPICNYSTSWEKPTFEQAKQSLIKLLEASPVAQQTEQRRRRIKPSRRLRPV